MDKPRILIVDPSRTSRAVVRAELNADEFEIFEADNGEEAVRLATKTQPTVVTLSMMLPPQDGLVTCEKIHTLPSATDISIIMITSRDSVEERTRAFEAGAMRFVTKGFPRGELTLYVDEIMRRRGSLNGITILAVDDSQFIRNSISRVLESEHATVLTADDGNTAIPILDENRVDVIITDYHMPNIDGLAFVKIVRSRREHSATPVLFLSGSEDRSAVIQALDAGATDFVRKPFDATELLARIRSFARIATATRELALRATTDELTGLLNRSEGMAAFRELCGSARRYETQFSCMLLDIDKFKNINDTRGHAAGDAVLRDLSGVLRGTLRDPDRVFRIGGEEFLVLLPHVGVDAALVCGERVRTAVSDHSFSFEGDEIGVTVSIGIGEYRPAMGGDDELFKAVDTALYAAKEGGRNRVCEVEANCSAV